MAIRKKDLFLNKECKYCGEIFTTYSVKQLFCNKPCYNRNRYNIQMCRYTTYNRPFFAIKNDEEHQGVLDLELINLSIRYAKSIKNDIDAKEKWENYLNSL